MMSTPVLETYRGVKYTYYKRRFCALSSLIATVSKTPKKGSFYKELGEACSTHGGEERLIEGFVGET